MQLEEVVMVAVVLDSAIIDLGQMQRHVIFGPRQ